MKNKVMSAVIGDKQVLLPRAPVKTYGTAQREIVFSDEPKPKSRKKRGKVDKAIAKSLNLKRAHQKHVNVSPAQMDKLTARVRVLMIGAFVAGVVAAALCCWAVNANSLHRAYINGYTSGKDSKVINYFTDTTP